MTRGPILRMSRIALANAGLDDGAASGPGPRLSAGDLPRPPLAAELDDRMVRDQPEYATDRLPWPGQQEIIVSGGGS